MPRIPGLLERIQQPLYDTVTITPKETYYKFFQIPLSSYQRASVLEAPINTEEIAPDTKCPLCKDFLVEQSSKGPFHINTLHKCSDCDTVYHKSCAREMGGCALLGCVRKGIHLSEPQTPKTLADTNMTQAGCLPYPKNFEIHSVGLHYDKTVDKYELEAFKEYSSFKLFVGCKDYLDLPVGVLDDIANHPRNSGSYIFAEPIDLIPLQNFYTSVTYEGPKKTDASFRVRCVMQGFFKREVY